MMIGKESLRERESLRESGAKNQKYSDYSGIMGVLKIISKECYFEDDVR